MTDISGFIVPILLDTIEAAVQAVLRNRSELSRAQLKLEPLGPEDVDDLDENQFTVDFSGAVAPFDNIAVGEHWFWQRFDSGEALIFAGFWPPTASPGLVFGDVNHIRVTVEDTTIRRWSGAEFDNSFSPGDGPWVVSDPFFVLPGRRVRFIVRTNAAGAAAENLWPFAFILKQKTI